FVKSIEGTFGGACGKRPLVESFALMPKSMPNSSDACGGSTASAITAGSSKPTQTPKPKKMNNTIRKLAALFLLMLSANFAVAVQWTAAGGTNLNWTLPLNWSSVSVPTAPTAIFLENALYQGGTNTQYIINNVVNSNFTVAELHYSAM